MIRNLHVLSALAVAIMCIWGCAQGPTGGAVSEAERIKALEAKNARLQEDYRAAAATRDQLRQKLAAAEEMTAQARQELDLMGEVSKECDELKQQVLARTVERDATQEQFDQFRGEIRKLLGQAETAARPSSEPVTTTSSYLPAPIVVPVGSEG
jgi:predicted nuclease with TOPRIM domain